MPIEVLNINSSHILTLPLAFSLTAPDATLFLRSPAKPRQGRGRLVVLVQRQLEKEGKAYSQTLRQGEVAAAGAPQGHSSGADAKSEQAVCE